MYLDCSKLFSLRINSDYFSYLASIFVSLLIIQLSGCGFFSSSVDYADSGATSSLEAPPDLVTPDWDETMDIPKSTSDRISALETQGPALGAAILPEFLEVRVRQEGPTRWIEVDSDPVSLWPSLRNFWIEEGFEIAEEEPVSGYIETEWKQNMVRSASKQNEQESFDVYGEKFRMRLERQPNAVTNIFLTQRGAEVAAINEQNQILWKPQQPDGEREAEMMIKLMEYLGLTIEEAQNKYATAESQFLYLDIKNMGGIPVLLVGDQYSRVWRRTGVALDRSGLFIEDHDRAKGIYYVSLDAESFGLNPQEAQLQSYEIHLLGQGKQTLVTVHEVDDSKVKIDAKTARQLLQRIVAAYPGSYPNA